MGERLLIRSPVEPQNIIMARGAQDPHTIAKTILHQFEHKSNEVVIRAIGAGAVNQTVKGIAIARGWVAQRAMDMTCRIGFTDMYDNSGEEFTAMVFRLNLS